MENTARVEHFKLSNFLQKSMRPKLTGASLTVQLVKNLPPMQETQVQFLGWEDPLEKGIATHSSILAWRTPWSEELERLQSNRSQT